MMNQKEKNNLIRAIQKTPEMNLLGLLYAEKRYLNSLRREYQPNKSDLQLDSDPVQERVKDKIEDSKYLIEKLEEAIAEISGGNDEIAEEDTWKLSKTLKSIIMIVKLKYLDFDLLNQELLKKYLRKLSYNSYEALEMFTKILKEADTLLSKDKISKIRKLLLFEEQEFQKNKDTYQFNHFKYHIFEPIPDDYIELDLGISDEKIIMFFSIFFREKNKYGEPYLSKKETLQLIRYKISYPKIPDPSSMFTIKGLSNEKIGTLFLLLYSHGKTEITRDDIAKYLKNRFHNFSKSSHNTIKAYFQYTSDLPFDINEYLSN